MPLQILNLMKMGQNLFIVLPDMSLSASHITKQPDSAGFHLREIIVSDVHIRSNAVRKYTKK